jgi:NAD(P)-dependent dehydrogenase (short-subunit alcohol dehydrogenase family)
VTAEQYDGRAIAGVPLGRIGTSEECAAVIVFLCSERASFVTGEIVNIDGGRHALYMRERRRDGRGAARVCPTGWRICHALL